MSAQSVDDATQKLTCPVVTTAFPAFTVAVSVIALPDATAVTAFPLEVTVNVVVVATLADAGGTHAHRNTHIAATEKSALVEILDEPRHLRSKNRQG